jgi:zinc protease
MERLMFRGSPRYAPGEYRRQLADLGATANTFLTPDYTSFFSTGPAGSLDGLLRLEADRMAGQRLTAANLAGETRALREEQRRLAESPVTRALQQLYARAFEGHPYANPIQGRPAHLAQLSLPATTAYARARYGPGNAVVTVVGAFDPATAPAALERTFGAVSRRDPPARVSRTEPAPGERRGSVRAPLRLAVAGWRAPADSACGAELSLLAHVLGAGASQRLGIELQGRHRIAVSTAAEFDGRRQASLFYALAVAAPGADSAALEQALVDQVERLAREPVSDDELTRARKALLLEDRLDGQTSRGRAQRWTAAALTDGDWRAADRKMQRIESITAAELQRVAAEVFVPGRRTVVWSNPGPAVAASKGGSR